MGPRHSYAELKKPDTDGYTVRVHADDTPEKTDLIHHDRKQISGVRGLRGGVGLTPEAHERTFWSAWGGGYMGVYIC